MRCRWALIAVLASGIGTRDVAAAPSVEVVDAGRDGIVTRFGRGHVELLVSTSQDATLLVTLDSGPENPWTGERARVSVEGSSAPQPVRVEFLGESPLEPIVRWRLEVEGRPVLEAHRTLQWRPDSPHLAISRRPCARGTQACHPDHAPRYLSDLEPYAVVLVEASDFATLPPGCRRALLDAVAFGMTLVLHSASEPTAELPAELAGLEAPDALAWQAGDDAIREVSHGSGVVRATNLDCCAETWDSSSALAHLLFAQRRRAVASHLRPDQARLAVLDEPAFRRAIQRDEAIYGHLSARVAAARRGAIAVGALGLVAPIALLLAAGLRAPRRLVVGGAALACAAPLLAHLVLQRARIDGEALSVMVVSRDGSQFDRTLISQRRIAGSRHGRLEIPYEAGPRTVSHGGSDAGIVVEHVDASRRLLATTSASPTLGANVGVWQLGVSDASPSWDVRARKEGEGLAGDAHARRSFSQAFLVAGEATWRLGPVAAGDLVDLTSTTAGPALVAGEGALTDDEAWALAACAGVLRPRSRERPFPDAASGVSLIGLPVGGDPSSPHADLSVDAQAVDLEDGRGVAGAWRGAWVPVEMHGSDAIIVVPEVLRTRCDPGPLTVVGFTRASLPADAWQDGCPPGFACARLPSSVLRQHGEDVFVGREEGGEAAP